LVERFVRDEEAAGSNPASPSETSANRVDAGGAKWMAGGVWPQSRQPDHREMLKIHWSHRRQGLNTSPVCGI